MHVIFIEFSGWICGRFVGGTYVLKVKIGHCTDKLDICNYKGICSSFHDCDGILVQIYVENGDTQNLRIGNWTPKDMMESIFWKILAFVEEEEMHSSQCIVE